MATGHITFITMSAQATGNLQQKTLKGIPDNMIVHEFNLNVVEPEPQIEVSDTFIAADAGAFLII